jgi:hypothetical protein
MKSNQNLTLLGTAIGTVLVLFLSSAPLRASCNSICDCDEGKCKCDFAFQSNVLCFASGQVCNQDSCSDLARRVSLPLTTASDVPAASNVCAAQPAQPPSGRLVQAKQLKARS